MEIDKAIETIEYDGATYRSDIYHFYDINKSEIILHR